MKYNYEYGPKASYALRDHGRRIYYDSIITNRTYHGYHKKRRKKNTFGKVLLIPLALVILAICLYIVIVPGSIHFKDTVQSNDAQNVYDTEHNNEEDSENSELNVFSTYIDDNAVLVATIYPEDGETIESVYFELLDDNNLTLYDYSDKSVPAIWTLPISEGNYGVRVVAKASGGSEWIYLGSFGLISSAAENVPEPDSSDAFSVHYVSDSSDFRSSLSWPLIPRFTPLAHDYYQVNSGNRFIAGYIHNNGLRRENHYIWRDKRNHYGHDITAIPESEIRAAADGVVYAVLYDSDSTGTTGYGKYLIIKHDKGQVLEDHTVYTLYAHLSEVLVKKDDIVAQGDVIALSGSTGGSLIPHLHFEVRIDDNYHSCAVNPLELLPEIDLSELKNVIDTRLGFMQSSSNLYAAILAGGYDYKVYALTITDKSVNGITISSGTEVEVISRTNERVFCSYDGIPLSYAPGELLYQYNIS